MTDGLERLMSNYRRPRTKWCTQTAIKLLQIGIREDFDAETRSAFVKVAAELDAFGQKIGEIK